MKRYVAAIGAITVVLAGCSGSSDAAATVNGTDISATEVEALVFDKGDDFGDEQFTQLLDVLIQWNAISDAAESDFAITPTSEEIAAQVEQLHAEQGAGQTFEEYLETQNISEAGLDLYAEQLIIGSAILEELTDTVPEVSEEEAQQLLADDPLSWTEVCAAHILVATSEEADAVVARLDAGEDFAALATELSTDTGSGSVGGDLGCASPARYVPEFAEATMSAEIGQVTDPVESQFGFHIVRVDSRTEATVEELQLAAGQEALGDAVDEWYLSSIVEADITIAEEWGTWQTEPAPGIEPPAA